MTSPPLRIVVASSHDWHAPVRLGSHQLARALARLGHRVLFLGPPASPVHLLGLHRPLVRARLEAWRRGPWVSEEGRLVAATPLALLAPANRPALRSRWLLGHWPQLVLPSLHALLERHGVPRPDILYLDSPLFAGLLQATPHRRSVFRIGDRLDAFAGQSAAHLEAIGRLARAVDLVVYSARGLGAYVEALQPRRLEHLANGVDYAHFAGAPADLPEPPDLLSIARPRAIYVGALESWFDSELLAAAAGRRPGVSFVLVGPDAGLRPRLARLPNLHLLGARPYASLPAYLRHADVGLIPFDVRRHAALLETVNPLKLYEYLASGLPVVAARWPELEALGSPARLYDDLPGFLAALDAALAAPPDADRLRRFAEPFDWLHGAAQLVRWLDAG